MSDSQGSSSSSSNSERIVSRSDQTRAWRIELNGEPIPTSVRKLTIYGERVPGQPDSRLVTVRYGAEPDKDGNPSKWDTVLVEGTGGGVIQPFAVIGGDLYLAVLQQRRNAEVHPVYNPSGMAPQAPRGAHDPRSMEGDKTARKELRGEVGAFPGNVLRLDGENVNPDSAWLTYEDERKDGVSVRQGGVCCYAIEVHPDFLTQQEDGSYKLPPEVAASRPPGSAYEKIGDCSFIPWQKVVGIRDGLTLNAVLRLIAHLIREGRAGLSFR